MKRIALLGLAVMTVAMSYAQGISGTWKGMLNAGNQKLEIVFISIRRKMEAVLLPWMSLHKVPWVFLFV